FGDDLSVNEGVALALEKAVPLEFAWPHSCIEGWIGRCFGPGGIRVPVLIVPENRVRLVVPWGYRTKAGIGEDIAYVVQDDIKYHIDVAGVRLVNHFAQFTFYKLWVVDCTLGIG